MVPDWLKAHLTQLGRWDSDGVSRRARLRVHTCGEPIVVGLDSERGGLAVAAQPDALDEVGELLAVVAGRGTYALRGLEIARPELDRRVSFHITGSPAGSARAPYVVGEHRCGDPLPASADPFPEFRRRAVVYRRSPALPADPPF